MTTKQTLNTTATALVTTAGLLLAAPAAEASLIDNGGFETPGTGGTDLFAAWDEGSGEGITDFTANPIAGSHSVKLERDTTGGFNDLEQVPTGTPSHWTVTFDIALSDPGSGSARSMQLQLAHATGNINLRVVDSDDNGIGDIELFDGSSFVAALADALTFSANDTSLQVNQLKLVGRSDQATPVYDVFATDAGGTQRSALGRTEWAGSAPTTGDGLTNVSFELGNVEAGAFSVVDNVSVVPEPATLALLALGGALMLGRRATPGTR